MKSRQLPGYGSRAAGAKPAQTCLDRAKMALQERKEERNAPLWIAVRLAPKVPSRTGRGYPISEKRRRRLQDRACEFISPSSSRNFARRSVARHGRGAGVEERAFGSGQV